ncbi:MAG: hypothetical protein H0X17_18135 [Deltaproteobacteria bacterium]|nr:hypothetical protein [Deltaproteobacteria bacterium]
MARLQPLRIVLGSLVVLALGACSQERAAPGSPMVAQARGLATEVCACKTTACVEPIAVRWDALMTERDRAELSGDEVEAIVVELQRSETCAARLRAGAPP